MAIIYIPVEVPDEQVSSIVAGLALGAVLGASEAVEAQSVPTQQFSQQPADPWASPAMQAQPPAAQPQPAFTPTATAAQPTQAPQCKHGPMRYVQGGFSSSTGKAYKAFWGCPAPRGAADKCQGITA